MKAFLIVLLMLVSVKAQAFDLLRLGDVGIEHKNFFHNVTPYLPDTHAANETNMKFGVVLIENMFWNNTIHSQMDKDQYRLVGWNWEFGVKLTDTIDFGWWHFSRHSIDNQMTSFPRGWNEDGLIIKFNLRKGKGVDPVW